MEEKVQFNKEIYIKEALDEGVKQFFGFIDAHIEENEAKYIVSIKLLEEDKENNIIDEFKNFVLFNSINV